MRLVNCCLPLILLLAVANCLSADITVRNTSGNTIEVRVDNGRKQELRPNHSATFKTSRTESTIEVFLGIDRKATGIVKDRSRIKVVIDNYNWLLQVDK